MKVGKFLKRVLSAFVGGATKAAEVISRVTEEALPVVELVASLTPTRSDDELIGAFKRFGVPLSRWWLAMPPEERGGALLELSTRILQRKFHLPVHQIQAGVQLALALNRSGEGVAGMISAGPTEGGDK